MHTTAVRRIRNCRQVGIYRKKDTNATRAWQPTSIYNCIHIHTMNALSTILLCPMRCDDDIRYFSCSQRLLSGDMYILNRPIYISIAHAQMIFNCILITIATKQRIIFVQKKKMNWWLPPKNSFFFLVFVLFGFCFDVA